MTSLIRVGPLLPLALAVTLSACARGSHTLLRGSRDRSRDQLTFEDDFQSFMESRVIAGFRSREDLDAFFSRNRFEEPLRKGQVTVFAKTATGKAISWPELAELEREREHVSGLEDQNLPWGYTAP